MSGAAGLARLIAMSRLARRASILLAAITLTAGCAPGLSTPPDFATDSGSEGGAATETSAPPAGPPAIAAPADDLSWTDCTTRISAAAGVPAPAGVKLECASFQAPMDPIGGGTGQLSIGAVKASSTSTPTDAGPVVFTTGSDLPSSLQLPAWLHRSGVDILAKHPIVAVDRRGMGSSDPIECRNPADRRDMRDQTQFSSGNDPVTRLGAITLTATTDCTDALANNAAYNNAHAGEDLEKLRSTWDVPALALIGVGNGAQVALSFAGAHPDKVARLVLDSPLPLTIGAEAAAQQALAGAQDALDVFAAQCAASACALGPDPKAAVTALLDDARADRGPAGMSVAVLVNAIITALGYPQGDGAENTRRLADALNAARGGDAGALTELVRAAEARTGTDGEFINRCSDEFNRPTPDRVRELVVAWGKQYPQFGSVAALNLVKCLNWPTSAEPTEPKELKVDVLLMGARNNPIVGSEGVAATAATVINAGATSRRVMWQGVGNGASIYSACAMPPLLSYLGEGNLPQTDTFCPA